MFKAYIANVRCAAFLMSTKIINFFSTLTKHNTQRSPNDTWISSVALDFAVLYVNVPFISWGYITVLKTKPPDGGEFRIKPYVSGWQLFSNLLSRSGWDWWGFTSFLPLWLDHGAVALTKSHADTRCVGTAGQQDVRPSKAGFKGKWWKRKGVRREGMYGRSWSAVYVSLWSLVNHELCKK